jgi:NTP pyrophosphatase (non-canonical NTP hydrolase)
LSGLRSEKGQQHAHTQPPQPDDNIARSTRPKLYLLGQALFSARARIEDDWGDILLHLLELANAYDIELAEAFRKILISNKKRFGMQ